VVDGAKFSALVESKWRLPDGDSKPVPVAIRLRITNLASDDRLFPMFDRFFLGVKGPDQRQIHGLGGRDWTRFINPIVIAPGQTYSICPSTKLVWNQRERRAELAYADGTGTWMSYGPLKAGRHTVSFSYTSANELKDIIDERTGGFHVWQGKV